MKLATVSVVALVLGLTPALASNHRGAEGPMMPQLDFATADANGDGAVSREEWQAYLGDLVQTRRATMLEARADALIEAGDANGDAMLDRAELIAGLEARHDAMRASMSERHEQRGERRAERGERRSEDGAGRRADREGRGQGHSMGRGAGMMSGDDFAERSFSRIDANDDGQISAEEFAAAQVQWQERASRRRGSSD